MTSAALMAYHAGMELSAMRTSAHQITGWMAILGGIVAIIGTISLLLLFVVGEPFGTLNDILSVPTAVLLLPMVIALYRVNSPDYRFLNLAAMVAGVSGFIVVAAGSVLLVLGQISFAQSLIPGIGGFGLIGLWMVLNSVLALKTHSLPAGLAWAGLLLGITPSLALLAVLRAETMANALQSMAGQSAGVQLSPLMTVLLLLGSLSYAGMPIWFIWVGRLFLPGHAAGKLAVP